MIKKTTVFQCKADEAQVVAREKINKLFRESPLNEYELMVNLPMYIRSSCLAKLLYIDELYKLITNVQGAIFEFGAWFGCNMVLFENLRAVYEPYSYTRRIVGFDTFSGYSGISTKDGEGDKILNGNYSVTKNYVEYLDELLHAHSQENVMSNIKKYDIVAGDAAITVKQYLAEHPETIIALAYFDMQLYSPTKECLKAILPHLTKGAVIAMDEVNDPEFPGETIAFNEVLGVNNCRIVRSKYLPDRSYIVIG